MDTPPAVRLAAALTEQAAGQPTTERAVLSAVTPPAITGADGASVTLPQLYPLLTPAAGDSVQIIRAGGGGLIAGSLTYPRHPGVTGTILTVSGTTVTVSTAVGTLSARTITGYTPAVGDIAACLWSPWPTAAGAWTGVVLGKVATAPTSSTGSTSGSNSDTGSQTPTRASGTDTIRPIEQDTWQSGWRGNGDSGDLIQGFISYAPNHAFSFYGSQFAAFRGATISRIDVCVAALPGIYTGTRYVRLVLHDASRKGAGQPSTVMSGISIGLAAGQTRWVQISTPFGQALADGSAVGIGAVSDASGDYMRLRGRYGDAGRRSADSFAVRLTWSR